MILLQQIQTKKRGNLGWKPLFAAALAVMKKQSKGEESGRRLWQWQVEKGAEVILHQERRGDRVEQITRERGRLRSNQR
jgi:hypothetical protein